MKRYKNIFYYTLLLGAILQSCGQDSEVTVLGGTAAPVLSVSSTATVVLTNTNPTYNSLQFAWTNPGYKFSNGVSTQQTVYTLQIDTMGANFTSPNKVSLTFTDSVNHTFTVKELNTALAGLQLPDYKPHNFQFRVLSSLPTGNNAALAEPLISNVIQVTISTYLDVVYPVPSALYITGSATAKSWMGGGDAPVPSQQFTKTNAYTFVITGIPLIGGDEFLLVPVYGNWNNKYGTPGANDTNNVSGGPFQPNGNNFLAPGASQNYTITVNFKTGKYSIQ
jgi:hypothetical protein